MSRIRNKIRPEKPVRLKPAVFHNLLALFQNSRHGLGIADEVERSTDGAMRLGPGTLYRSLKEMSRDGLVDEVAVQRPDQDPRRKLYRITARRRKLVRIEAERYESIVEVARRRDVLPQSRS